jgi:hypothetical protein
MNNGEAWQQLSPWFIYTNFPVLWLKNTSDFLERQAIQLSNLESAGCDDQNKNMKTNFIRASFSRIRMSCHTSGFLHLWVHFYG